MKRKYLDYIKKTGFTLLCAGLCLQMLSVTNNPVSAENLQIKSENVLDFSPEIFSQEGYAAAYSKMDGTDGVTGGGVLAEESDDYFKVSDAKEFLTALTVVKASGRPSVIELTGDVNLGCNEVEEFAKYKSVIKAYGAQPLTHPTLLKTGTSVLKIEDISNLTLFSANGSAIKHANITMNNVSNIIIRNIKFDELWEWDEDTKGEYDRNDWDYMTLDKNCDGVWIDHCTFYKAYDGIVDVKNPAPETNVTISWCEFLPGSEGDAFFEEMMAELVANSDKYPTYKALQEKGMTGEQIHMYCYGQKKTHLFGHSDNSTAAAGIRATLANNYYKDSMDRMPRLRYGYSHVYNCVMDSQELLDVKNTIADSALASEIVSNGASSTCEGYVLLENCYINGITNAMNSGNGKSPSGYINAVNSSYYINGEAAELAPKCNTSGDTRVLITDAAEFVEKLPYQEYRLYEAESLYSTVVPYAGAGRLDCSEKFWMMTDYEGVKVADIESTDRKTSTIEVGVGGDTEGSAIGTTDTETTDIIPLVIGSVALLALAVMCRRLGAAQTENQGEIHAENPTENQAENQVEMQTETPAETK